MNDPSPRRAYAQYATIPPIVLVKSHAGSSDVTYSARAGSSNPELRARYIISGHAGISTRGQSRVIDSARPLHPARARTAVPLDLGHKSETRLRILFACGRTKQVKALRPVESPLASHSRSLSSVAMIAM